MGKDVEKYKPLSCTLNILHYLPNSYLYFGICCCCICFWLCGYYFCYSLLLINVKLRNIITIIIIINNNTNTYVVKGLMPSNSARYTKSVELHYESGKMKTEDSCYSSFVLGTHQTVLNTVWCILYAVYCMMYMYTVWWVPSTKLGVTGIFASSFFHFRNNSNNNNLHFKNSISSMWLFICYSPNWIGILGCWFLWREEKRSNWRKSLEERR